MKNTDCKEEESVTDGSDTGFGSPVTVFQQITGADLKSRLAFVLVFSNNLGGTQNFD